MKSDEGHYCGASYPFSTAASRCSGPRCSAVTLFRCYVGKLQLPGQSLSFVATYRAAAHRFADFAHRYPLVDPYLRQFYMADGTDGSVDTIISVSSA